VFFVNFKTQSFEVRGQNCILNVYKKNKNKIVNYIGWLISAIACRRISKVKGNDKYDKQDRQGKAAFNERSPHPTQSLS
jgi:hypothetical protein